MCFAACYYFDAAFTSNTTVVLDDNVNDGDDKSPSLSFCVLQAAEDESGYCWIFLTAIPLYVLFLNVEMCDKTHEESHGLFYSSGSFTYYWNNCVEDKIVE